jgi:hypothetical protein
MDPTPAPPTPSHSMTFFSLPAELRQYIYKIAATDNSRDFVVTFTLHQNTQSGNGALRSQALAVFQKLYNVSMLVRQDIGSFMTFTHFRWVLISDAQPHLYLLRKLLWTIPEEIRSKIVHVYLPRIRLQEHCFLNASPVDNSSYINQRI